MGLDRAYAGVYAVDATDPVIRFVVDVSDSVAVRAGTAETGVPCLCGEAVELIEALSLRTPMPATTPLEWSQLLGGLETVFGAVPAS